MIEQYKLLTHIHTIRYQMIRDDTVLCKDFKCVRKPTKSRLSLINTPSKVPNEFSRWTIFARC